MPGWRNWQTQRTQNPPVLGTLQVRFLFPAPEITPLRVSPVWEFTPSPEKGLIPPPEGSPVELLFAWVCPRFCAGLTFICQARAYAQGSLVRNDSCDYCSRSYQTAIDRGDNSPASSHATTCIRNNGKPCPEWLRKMIGQYPVTASADSENAVRAWKYLLRKKACWIRGNCGDIVDRARNSVPSGEIAAESVWKRSRQEKPRPGPR